MKYKQCLFVNKWYVIVLRLCFAMWCSLGALSNATAQNKISITRQMVTVLTPGENTINKLFDQDLTTVWFPGWNATYPAEVIIDLGRTWKLSRLRLLNYQGTRKFKVLAGNTPFNLQLLVEDNFTAYNKWYEYALAHSARYLKVVIPESKAESPASMEIYGTQLQAQASLPIAKTAGAPAPDSKYTFGVNTFHWVPLNKQTNFTAFREYQEWQWMEQQDGKFTFSPTRQADANYDQHYRDLKEKNIFVVPCIHQAPEWMKHGNDWNGDNKPIYKGSDPLNAKSYFQIASFFYQLAARYGSQKVPEENLDIDISPRWTNDPVNTKVSGLDLLRYIECWNEPDKTWKGAASYFSPFEFAAMMSACADSHEGTLGDKAGIKRADPKMKVVMGGLCNLNLDYLKGMDMWFRTFRKDQKWPVDVINFHYYSNSSGFQYGQDSYGISPEQDKLKQKLKEAKQFIHSQFGVAEIWLSEYGYDSNKGSMQRAPGIGSMDPEEVQAIWVVRSQLEIAASGIDKAFLYSIYDENEGNGLYASSGVLGTLPALVKKPAWYYCNITKSLLSDLKFTADQSNDKFRKYIFSGASRDVYALWLPTSKDQKSQLSLDLGKYQQCHLVPLVQSEVMKKTQLEIALPLQINITEKPVFVDCLKKEKSMPGK